MAHLQDRLPQNVPGRFYVDAQCINHVWCEECAPANFAYDDEQAIYYVRKQPENPEELVQCLQAAAECPVAAIGTDGDVMTTA